MGYCVLVVGWDRGTYKETEGKDADQADLLAPAEVEAGHGREREHKDDDVGDDVTRRVGIPEGEVGDAGAGRLGKPKLVDGRAGEDDDKELRDGPQGHKDKGGDDEVAHVAPPKDAVVLEEEGELGCCQGAVVEHDRDVELLVRRLAGRRLEKKP